MQDKKDLIAIFKAETEEHLTNLDKGLVELEKQPENIELLDMMGGEMHTVKGSARVFGYHEIEEIAHRIEDVFGKLQQKSISFNSNIADAIFRSIDVIKAVLEKIIKEERIDIDISEVCGDLEKCMVSDAEVDTSDAVRESKRDKDKKKKDEPPVVVTSRKEEHRESDSGKKKDLSREKDFTEEEDVPVKGKQEVLAEEYIRVPLGRINKLLNLVGQLVINKMKSSQKIKQAKSVTKMIKEVQKNVSNLMDMVKESNISEDTAISRILNQCNADMQRLRENSVVLYENISTEIFHLDPTIEELQSNMKELRMLPCSTIFEAFPRMIRDIAHQEGKFVNLEIHGEKTELDKKVLEGIKAPLMHILRNSVDHGIEDPATREKLDKPKYGTIKLSAYHEAGNVIIVIEDDGQGINLERIKEVAVKQRLINLKDMESMDDKDIMNLVFMNGFSTSPIITDVSGRGIGLDVVRKDIENLKGKIVIDTEKDKGTKVTLILPLTIAIIQVFLVREKGVSFAFPMSSITETLKVRPEDIYTLEGREAIQHRDHTMPLVRLNKVLGLPDNSYALPEESREKDIDVIIGTSLDKKVGFIVDEIVEEEEVFIKSLGKHLKKVRNVSGVTVLGTGQVIVVLDVADLINQSNLGHPAVRGRSEIPRERKKEKKILVVEDAISTRELEKSILESEGYVVDTAVDGMDALDRVMQTEYDLVITDVNMPRMDGFEFCETVKKNEKLQEIPIVIVTSLEKEEEKRRGIRAGASAYITKTSFDQTNLLDTIDRLIG